MFTTPLDLRAHSPGEWVLLRRLVWDDGERKVVVPRGFITDLASIPGPLKGVLDVNGKSRRAAVLHDFLYCWQPFTRREVDRMFKAALRKEGVGALVASIYYTGVRIGGGRYWGSRWGQGLATDDIAEGF